MDIVLAFISICIITIVWIRAGVSESGSAGFKDVWKIPFTGNVKSSSNKERLERRRHALAIAKPFLKYYADPMGELCLANENCKVNIVIEGKNLKKIICISKTVSKDNTRKILTAVASKDFETFYNMPYSEVVDNLFDIICHNFTYTTVYENIYSALTTGMLEIKESVIAVPRQSNKTQKVYDKVTNTSIRTNNLLNINTASEAELSSLPGVNIVTAKKIIKYIEKNGPFNSVDEFIEKMKIKDVFAQQIQDIVCTKLDAFDDAKNNNDISEGNLDLPEINNEDSVIHSENERIIDL